MRARKLKARILTLYYAAKHPDLPRRTKLLILFTLAYALSPVDLIPDFIPVIGYLDDLILLPLLIALCLKSIPRKVWIDARHTARENPLPPGKNWIAGIIILLIWAAVITRIVIALI